MDMIVALKDLELKDMKNSGNCCHCGRLTNVNELFCCKSCQNETDISSKLPLMCSLCALKLHKGHDIEGDIATDETREEYARIVDHEGQTATNFFGQVVVDFENSFSVAMSQMLTILRSKIHDYSKYYEALQIECLSNKNLLKSDLSNKIMSAKVLKDRMGKVSNELTNLNSKLIGDLQNFSANIGTVLTNARDIPENFIPSFSCIENSHVTPKSLSNSLFDYGNSAVSVSSKNIFTICDSTTRPRRKKPDRRVKKADRRKYVA